MLTFHALMKQGEPRVGGILAIGAVRLSHVYGEAEAELGSGGGGADVGVGDEDEDACVKVTGDIAAGGVP